MKKAAHYSGSTGLQLYLNTTDFKASSTRRPVWKQLQLKTKQNRWRSLDQLRRNLDQDLKMFSWGHLLLPLWTTDNCAADRICALQINCCQINCTHSSAIRWTNGEIMQHWSQILEAPTAPIICMGHIPESHGFLSGHQNYNYLICLWEKLKYFSLLLSTHC